MYSQQSESAEQRMCTNSVRRSSGRHADHYIEPTQRPAHGQDVESGCAWNGTASMIFADPPM